MCQSEPWYFATRRHTKAGNGVEFVSLNNPHLGETYPESTVGRNGVLSRKEMRG